MTTSITEITCSESWTKLTPASRQTNSSHSKWKTYLCHPTWRNMEISGRGGLGEKNPASELSDYESAVRENRNNGNFTGILLRSQQRLQGNNSIGGKTSARLFLPGQCPRLLTFLNKYVTWFLVYGVNFAQDQLENVQQKVREEQTTLCFTCRNSLLSMGYWLVSS